MTHYNIVVTSDIVCPWCYIGHSRLTKAINKHKTRFPDDTFNLKYLPYYLNPPPQQTATSTKPVPPPFPVHSRPRREMYAEKFGPARAQQIEAMMTQVSRGEGLSFKFGGQTGPSRNGHRLVHYAQQTTQGRQADGANGNEEAQNEVMLGLWRRYFEREVDVTELEVLVEVGVEARLGTADEIRRYLLSGEGGEEVDRVAEEKRLEGISGVPHYVVQDVWEVSGAQDPTAFEKLFVRWKEMEEKKQKKGAEAGSQVGVGKGAGPVGNGCL